MPFIKLVDRHSCPTPKTRDHGSALVIGDEWQCDVELVDGSGRTCNKIWRWTDSQAEGSHWSEIQEKKNGPTTD